MYVRNSSKKRKYLIVKLFGTRSSDRSLYVCSCRYNGCINRWDVHITEPPSLIPISPSQPEPEPSPLPPSLSICRPAGPASNRRSRRRTWRWRPAHVRGGGVPPASEEEEA